MYFYFFLLKVDGYKANICSKIVKKKEIQQNILDLDEQLDKYIEELKDVNSDKTFNGTAFVSFDTEKDVKKFQDKYQDTEIKMHFFYIKDYILNCFKTNSDRDLTKFLYYNAPNPTEIRWENLDYPAIERMKRSSLLYFVSFLILIGSLGVLTVIGNYQSNFKYTDYRKNLVSAGFASVISIVNYIISQVLIKLSE